MLWDIKFGIFIMGVLVCISQQYKRLVPVLNWVRTADADDSNTRTQISHVGSVYSKKMMDLTISSSSTVRLRLLCMFKVSFS